MQRCTKLKHSFKDEFTGWSYVLKILDLSCKLHVYRFHPLLNIHLQSKYLGTDLLLFASKEEKYCRGQGGCEVKEHYVELLMQKNTFKKIIVAFLSQFLFL